MSHALTRAHARVFELERENEQLKQDKAVMQHVVDSLMAVQRGEQPPPTPEWMRTPTPPDANARGGEA